MSKLSSYFKLSKLELGKVIFPLKNQVRGAFVSVILVVAISVAFLALIDLLMSLLLSWILG